MGTNELSDELHVPCVKKAVYLHKRDDEEVQDGPGPIFSGNTMGLKVNTQIPKKASQNKFAQCSSFCIFTIYECNTVVRRKGILVCLQYGKNMGDYSRNKSPKL